MKKTAISLTVCSLLIAMSGCNNAEQGKVASPDIKVDIAPERT